MFSGAEHISYVDNELSMDFKTFTGTYRSEAKHALDAPNSSLSIRNGLDSFTAAGLLEDDTRSMDTRKIHVV